MPISIPSFFWICNISSGKSSGFFNAWFSILKYSVFSLPTKVLSFASLGSDKTLVGKEKTAYFQQLHKVLRNPDDFPDFIQDIQKRLGIGPIGFKSGGLAGILEV